MVGINPEDGNPILRSVAVAGISGCNGWSSKQAPSPEFHSIPLKGREVFCLPDSDVATNRSVWSGMKFLGEHLVDEFLVVSLRFITLPGRGNDGADDMLARHPIENRPEILQRLISKARGKEGLLPKRPPAAVQTSLFFDQERRFLPATFWNYLSQEYDMAISGDQSIAFYARGIYWNGESRRFSEVVSRTLGNDYHPSHLRTITDFALDSLKVSGREVLDFVKEPLLNVLNGLVDLRTGEMADHRPEFIVTTQLPVKWNPGASCPTWEWLIESQLPGQIERLEDVISQMLDWTRCPTKILLLYGASRAGKGLILRVIEALIGRGNFSAVTLHQLADDKFMAAELYGKRANIAGELKPDEVRDIAAVKIMTGGDPIQANRKYGATFTFYCRAFLAFSCNKLPPVNETTKAFTTRIAPFRFEVGHFGKEDHSLEGKLKMELPGILVRLVKAWQRREEREGSFLQVDEVTAQHFAENVDHVARFLRERTLPVDRLVDGVKKSELFERWKEWCHQENLVYAAKTARQTFFEKVRNAGVVDRKDKQGFFRWERKLRGDDPDKEGPEDGKGPPEDGNGTAAPVEGTAAADGHMVAHGTPSGGETTETLPETAPEGPQASVPKPVGMTGELGGKRQKRQEGGAKPSFSVLGNSPAELNFPYGQDGKNLPSLPSLRTYPPPPSMKARAARAAGARPAHDRPAAGPEPQSPPAETAEVDLPAKQTADLSTESAIGKLPIELLAVRGDTAPMVVDLETCSADRLWEPVTDPAAAFVRLVGTDHGISASPASLLDHAGPLVAHNGFGFDFLALARHHGLPLLELSEGGKLIDTMVLDLTLNPPEVPISGKLNGGQVRKLYSLNKCAERAGLPGKTDDLGKLAIGHAKAAGHTGKPTELAAIGYGLIPRNHPDYISDLRGDVAATRALFDHLCPGGTLPAYVQREMRIMGRLVAGITLAGTRLDVDLTRARYDEVEARKEVCRTLLVDRYGLPTHKATGALATNPLNCTGGAEAIAAAAADVGLELPRTEKTGRPTTSKEHLGPMLEEARAVGNQQQVDLLETILGLTGARSVYGTALDYLQPDGRLHPQVAPLQTSGRFSITGPGITVFGKRGGRVVEREIFLPDSSDHVLVSIDLAQIDMRAMAAHAQDPAYLELFAPGRDAHAEIAAAVGLTREEAKRVGHGWNYGMGINGLVGSGVGRAVAEKFDAGMRRRFPKLVAWRDRIRDMAEAGRRLDNGFGRMMKPNRERAHTQSPALMGQGTARDLMMEAVLRLPVEIVPMLRLLVHDELVFSIPMAEADRIEPLILEAMNFEWAPPGADLQVAVTADLAKRGQNWADCYQKD